MLAIVDAESIQPSDAATTVEHSPEAKDQAPALAIKRALLDRIVAHLRAALPNEGCGLVAGVPHGDGHRAVWFFPGTNIDASPKRYTMEPKEVVQAFWWMRTLGWELVAIAHSHPSSDPTASRTDRREWYYPAARLLIVSFTNTEHPIRCWGLSGDGESREVRECRLDIIGR